MKQGARSLLVTLGLTALACTSGSAFPLGSAEPEAFEPATIAEVNVEMDEEELAEDRERRYRDYAGDGRIRAALVERLEREGRYDGDSPFSMHVRITGFKLRSTANAFWNGSMAGPDHLSAEIQVKTGESVVKRYEASVSSLRGGIFFPGATGRFDNMARKLAEELVDELP